MPIPTTAPRAPKNGRLSERILAPMACPRIAPRINPTAAAIANRKLPFRIILRPLSADSRPMSHRSPETCQHLQLPIAAYNKNSPAASANWGVWGLGRWVVYTTEQPITIITVWWRMSLETLVTPGQARQTAAERFAGPGGHLRSPDADAIGGRFRRRFMVD